MRGHAATLPMSPGVSHGGAIPNALDPDQQERGQRTLALTSSEASGIQALDDSR
jgi:hypothetical protein